MDEFFYTDFGSDFKTNTSKTKKRVDGQNVYKVGNKNLKEYGLKNGNQIYLDGLYKDHLSNGKNITLITCCMMIMKFMK